MDYTVKVGVGSCKILPYTGVCVSMSSLKTPVYVHDYVQQSLYQDSSLGWEHFSAWTQNMLPQCSLLCSSGSLELVLHSHQHPLDISDLIFGQAPPSSRLHLHHGPTLIKPHPHHSSTLITVPPLATVWGNAAYSGRSESGKSQAVFMFCLSSEDF